MVKHLSEGGPAFREPWCSLVDVMAGKKRNVSGFAERLVQVRKARGMTQVQLATAIGVTQAIISKYENEVSDPAASAIAEIARVLGVSADVLLGVKQGRLPRDEMDAKARRLWKNFQKVRILPQRDQRAVIRLVHSLARNSGSHATL
jgi:transcriptional regulator with XRE-family HTH domain